MSSVVIVGAGAAGLAAAGALAAAGVSSVLLEAQPRIGGRIRTLRPAGWPSAVEAGAEFIHGEVSEFDTILKRASLTVSEHAARFWDARGGVNEIDFGEQWEILFDRLRAAAQEADESFASFLDRRCADLPADVRRRGVDYIEGFNAADRRRISIRWICQTEEAIGEETLRRIPSGYDGVTQALAARLNTALASVRTESTVTEIRWRRGSVEIDAREKGALVTHRAPRALVTLPLGVLKASPDAPGGVRFLPQIISKRRACEGLCVGSVVKAVLAFRERFWERRGMRGWGLLHAAAEKFLTWWPCEGVPVLIAWAAGPRADALSGWTEARLIAEAKEALGRMLGASQREIEEQFVEGLVFDWQSDCFARGAYSYAAAGHAGASADLAAPLEETLFFAGEATAGPLAATVGGAIASGLRAAREIVAAQN